MKVNGRCTSFSSAPYKHTDKTTLWRRKFWMFLKWTLCNTAARLPATISISHRINSHMPLRAQKIKSVACNFLQQLFCKLKLKYLINQIINASATAYFILISGKASVSIKIHRQFNVQHTHKTTRTQLV